MMEEKCKEETKNKFQKNKIMSLNKFFMRKATFGTTLTIFLYILTFVFLFLLINHSTIDESLKITLISMVATFILTTSKTMLEKIFATIDYILTLLGNEQRGLHKNIGIEVEKVELDTTHESDSDDESKTST